MCFKRGLLAFLICHERGYTFLNMTREMYPYALCGKNLCIKANIQKVFGPLGLPHIPDSSLWCLGVKATVGKNPPTNLIISHLTFLWRCIRVPMPYAPKSLHEDSCVYYIKCSVTIFEAFLCLCNKSVETTDEKRIWQSAWKEAFLISSCAHLTFVSLDCEIAE